MWAIIVGVACASAQAANYRVEVVVGGPQDRSTPPVEQPFGCEFDSTGGLWFVEFTNHRLRLRSPDGVSVVMAGTGRKGWTGDGGPAMEAAFNGVHNLAIGPDGSVYLADTFNNRVRRYDPRTGIIMPFAGRGNRGYSGDGEPAIKADLAGPHCVAFNPDFSRLYIADLENRRIRYVDMKSLTIHTLAGSGARGEPVDQGEAIGQPLVDPRAVAADGKGNVYIVERGGHALRKVDATGRISTVAGTGRKGDAIEDGSARLAEFNGPKHACCDGTGNVFIADTENHVIRKLVVDQEKVIRIAGTGVRGSNLGDGNASNIQIRQPHGVTVRSDGTVYICDSGNHRILRLTPTAVDSTP